jgi:hypothetical protein
VSDIRCTAGRNTKGVRVMRLKDGEALLGISKVERSDEEEENAAKPQA